MYVYPYGDSQQLNLDWIIKTLKELEAPGTGADLEEISEALISLKYDTATLYARYDYAFYNGKLYRCLSGTSGTFDPDAWQEALIGDDLAVLTRWINALNAAAVVDVKFDTSGTNGKLQQKYNDTYHEVVEVDYTPVQYSKRPLSSNAGYDLKGAITPIQFVSFDTTSITTQVDALPNSGHFSGTVSSNTVGMPTTGAGNVEVFAYSTSQKRIYFYPNGSDDECYMLEKRSSWRSWITLPTRTEIDAVETAIIPTPATIVSSSEHVTINSQKVYKVGKIVVVSVAIIIDQAFTATTELFSGLPAPSSITELYAIRSNETQGNVSASAQGCYILSTGKLYCDSGIDTGIWYINTTYISS